MTSQVVVQALTAILEMSPMSTDAHFLPDFPVYPFSLCGGGISNSEGGHVGIMYEDNWT